MTVMGRDASDFDPSVSYDGLGFLTHKATEGTTVTHPHYGPRLAAGRSAGVPVLGSYHVLRTPGNGGAGSLAAQLGYWVSYQDAHTPWWRTWPHWMMQVDAETWKYDAVSATTVLQFAAMLAGAGLPGYKVTYASRGQYGDTLTGIATDLWNADYRGGGPYPGDDWTTAGGRAAGWAPYSGRVPRFLQYTSNFYDHDAYRGSLADLLTLTGGNDDMAALPDYVWCDNTLWGVFGPTKWPLAETSGAKALYAANGRAWTADDGQAPMYMTRAQLDQVAPITVAAPITLDPATLGGPVVALVPHTHTPGEAVAAP